MSLALKSEEEELALLREATEWERASGPDFP